jgi:hypothetical protein
MTLPAKSERDVIEVVYMRYFQAYLHGVDSIEEALRFIDAGEDAGEMSSVGVFVNGQPHIYDGYINKDPGPNSQQAEGMRKAYREAT